MTNLSTPATPSSPSPDGRFPDTVTLLYDDDGYVETTKPVAGRAGSSVFGLMGRQVAGKAFLEGLLTYGRSGEYVGLIGNQPSEKSFHHFCQTCGPADGRARKYRTVNQGQFHKQFFPTAPSPVLHLPQPPTVRFAWARHHGGPGAFAISGVTHTLSSAGASEMLTQLVVAPFEPYDTIICTSVAVEKMVRATTGAFADYLRDRFGGQPGLNVRLATIPLGVDTKRYRPPTAAERAEVRRRYRIADDEVVVLFVGRLSLHAKANPFPMVEGLGRAARASGKKVRLICSGWAANPAIGKAWADAAKDFAPEVRTDFVDGTDPAHRYAIWHAADIFTSLSDSVQETFGLVIVEAMACGLPVVCTDWDGYRDLVVPDRTGFAVPTRLVRGATVDTTSRLLVEELNYDHFLGECSQATAVDVAEAARAYRRLIEDESLRRDFGDAGRARAESIYDWSHVVRAYESLWVEMDAERVARLAAGDVARSPTTGPARYPAPEVAFAGYPTHWVEDDDRLTCPDPKSDRLQRVLAHIACSYTPFNRTIEPDVLRRVMELAADPTPVARLDEVFTEAGLVRSVGRASIAWLMKYGLLVPAGSDRG